MNKFFYVLACAILVFICFQGIYNIFILPLDGDEAIETIGDWKLVCYNEGNFSHEWNWNHPPIGRFIIGLPCLFFKNSEYVNNIKGSEFVDFLAGENSGEKYFTFLKDKIILFRFIPFLFFLFALIFLIKAFMYLKDFNFLLFSIISFLFLPLQFFSLVYRDSIYIFLTAVSVYFMVKAIYEQKRELFFFSIFAAAISCFIRVGFPFYFFAFSILFYILFFKAENRFRKFKISLGVILLFLFMLIVIWSPDCFFSTFRLYLKTGRIGFFDLFSSARYFLVLPFLFPLFSVLNRKIKKRFLNEN